MGRIGTPRPGNGGKRPGAGRKPDAVRAYQAKMQEAVRRCVTIEDMADLTERTFARAKAGDSGARQWISDWVLGKVPTPIEISGPDGRPIRTESFDFGSALAPIAGGPETDSEAPG